MLKCLWTGLLPIGKHDLSSCLDKVFIIIKPVAWVVVMFMVKLVIESRDRRTWISSGLVGRKKIPYEYMGHVSWYKQECG